MALLPARPRHVRPQALADLRTMVDIAGDFGLDVCVDTLQGHLSSFDFYPSWTQTWHRRNIFTDADATQGEQLFLRSAAEAVADAPNLLGLTVGNEMNNLIEHNPATTVEVDSWIDAMLAARRRLVRRRTSVHAHCLGAQGQPDHGASVGVQQRLRAGVMARSRPRRRTSRSTASSSPRPMPPTRVGRCGSRRAVLRTGTFRCRRACVRPSECRACAHLRGSVRHHLVVLA